MQCVILAGGLATRMKPYTDTRPKSLLPVAGKPFLNHQLVWLARQGVSDVLLCIAHLGQMIRDYVGDGSAWNLRVRYSDEGQDARGTAGALRVALNQGLLDDPFFILYGDSYLQVEIPAVWTFFNTRSESALMTVFKNNNRWDKSNISYADHKILRYEKVQGDPDPGMNYIDYGLSLLRRRVVENEVPNAVKSDLADVFRRLSQCGDVAGFEVEKRFYEIGSPTGLAEMEAHLMNVDRNL